MSKEIDNLHAVVRQLRAENGCPWDRKQTHESLKPECIEEAAEVIGGINILNETGSAENLKEELGDLLLQVVFHSTLAEEEGLFTLEDVAKGAADKMIRRHPHVFGEEAARAAMPVCAAQVQENQDRSTQEAELTAWEKVKKAEKYGREWEADYLPQAFSEAQQLIETARIRKNIQSRQ